MQTKEKLTTGFLILLSVLGSSGLTTLLDSDRSTYECVSKGLVSDCVNGVKACNGGVCTRCYYDPENTRKYEYCKEGWNEIIKELEEIPTSTIPSDLGAQKYLCDQTKCVPIG